MAVTIGTTQLIIDKQQRDVGTIHVEQIEGDLVLGQFVAGAGFSEIAPNFERFEVAANSNALKAVDTIDREIAELGLGLAMPEGSPLAIRDVQIWTDGGISFRIRSSTAILLDGAVQSTRLRIASN